ncbi:GIY-YIG nuclease family protein [Neolewinella agarilytica]|uniref:GIY-YIG catalytic domain-containing protein n=1 Tax=Neolewinella agarilytica TaxID=478744 RepID=A0A1H9NUK0_9BACT|nr:GIY-YIG nuclease family protein [Neolewinella agarilytica]SER39013.1 GIY-YIG catalytic domain-containing protein [Neolewinella agarilytica]
MDDKIEKYLAKLENEITDGNWKLFEFSKDWLMTFDTEAGVYAIREEGKLCYVGETGSIRKRMKDLLDTRNHSLRRTIGNKRFSDKEGYVVGTASKKFPDKFEEKLNRIFEDNFEVSAIVVKIGRKELEERLVEKLKPIYNSREKRKADKPQKAYSISEIRNTHQNAYRPWNEEEERKIIELSNQGKTAKEIREIVGRNKGAISSRLRKIRERSERSS